MALAAGHRLVLPQERITCLGMSFDFVANRREARDLMAAIAITFDLAAVRVHVAVSAAPKREPSIEETIFVEGPVAGVALHGAVLAAERITGLIVKGPFG